MMDRAAEPYFLRHIANWRWEDVSVNGRRMPAEPPEVPGTAPLPRLVQ